MDEKICKLFLPLLDKLYNQEPAGEPFREPVDVVKYNCTNYYEIVKHPIDLSTIRERLTSFKYKDAWRFIADIQLMFSNAYLFNRRGTPVYEYTNKLNKIWTAELTPIMQRLNYCCGTLHKFGPQLLFCHGTTPDKYCQIPIGAKYKCYDDQYSFCQACFNRFDSDQIIIPALSETQPVNKRDFVDCTNSNWQYESFIQCTRCTRRVHSICELYPDGDDSNCIQHDQIEFEQKNPDQVAAQDLAQNELKFVCNHCYRKEKIGFDLRHRKYSARPLPHTKMSKYIETKVNDYMRANSPSAGELTIRVLTAHRDTFPVKKEMRDYVRQCREDDEGSQRYPNSKDYPDAFSYTSRAVFAWQEIDRVDVCVFGMHVQEYGEDCPEPNRQVVYLSYLDSVNYFRPKQVRTAVYHEILLSYFKYVKKLGFRKVFIWVCPSRKGDDYIFYRHPTDQRMPTQKRLLDWYIKMLDKGIVAGIVERHQNIYQYAATENWTSVLSMPYLSGDYWPGEFERLIGLMNDPEEDIEVKMETDLTELTPEQEMTKNFQRSLHKQREGFIVAELNDCDSSPHLEQHQRRKSEQSFTCDLMKGREPFLLLSRQKNYEFSTLRRAKYSSLAMVKQLEGKPFMLSPIYDCFGYYGCDSSNPLSVVPREPTPPPSHIATNVNGNEDVLMYDIDRILVQNFIEYADVNYDLDYDQMKNESRRILAHYWSCPLKETCHRCKFVVLSCSFMSRWMRNSMWQNIVNSNQSEKVPNSNADNNITTTTNTTTNNNINTTTTTNHFSAIDLTTAHRISYHPKDK